MISLATVAAAVKMNNRHLVTIIINNRFLACSIGITSYVEVRTVVLVVCTVNCLAWLLDLQHSLQYYFEVVQVQVLLYNNLLLYLLELTSVLGLHLQVLYNPFGDVL